MYVCILHLERAGKKVLCHTQVVLRVQFVLQIRRTASRNARNSYAVSALRRLLCYPNKLNVFLLSDILSASGLSCRCTVRNLRRKFNSQAMRSCNVLMFNCSTYRGIFGSYKYTG